MIAKVDADACIGCALCEQSCPEVYKMEDDKAIVAVDTIPAEVEGAAKQAAEDCPVDAIVIE